MQYLEKAFQAAAVASFSHVIPQLRQPQLQDGAKDAGASRPATVPFRPGVFPGSGSDRTLLYFKLCYTLFHEGCGLISNQLVYVITQLQPIWLRPFLFTCPTFIVILYLVYLKNSTLICPLSNGLL